MIRKIVDVNDKNLRKKSKPVKKVDKKIKRLIKDLKDTLETQNDPEGVGLAAPQVGVNKRIFIMRSEEGIKTMINPKILSADKYPKKSKKDKEKVMEGCLSLPHFYGPLIRPQEVEVEYLDENGEKKKEKMTGFDAQIVQHEVDHLNGKLFIDHLLEQKKPLYEYDNGEWYKVDLPH